jgi:hypothetical protein
LEKLEAAVKKLAADMAELRGDADGLRGDFDELKDTQHETLAAVKNIQRTQTALTSAITSAIKELSTTRSLDLRLKRLEDAVFGSKH